MSFWGSKLSWILLIVAIVGDFVVAYVLACFYPDYSHMKQTMSVLGNLNSPVAFLYNMWLIILGILICISAGNFYIVYSDSSKILASIGLIILLFFGIGAGIISGIFSVNEGLEIETIASKIPWNRSRSGFSILDLYSFSSW